MTQLQDLVHDCGPLPDDDLLAALGSALDGSGVNVAPLDAARFRRFARRWLETKAQDLRRSVEATATYKIWAETAGTEQVLEPDLLAAALAHSGVPDEIAAPAALLLQRKEIAAAEDYDVAVSCAEAQTGYVTSVVSAARARDLRVFHDRDMTYEWWGRNFLAEGRRVYGRSALHFVPFLSAEYLRSPQPLDAFQAATAAAVHRGDDYILPVVVGAVRVPEELLPRYVGFLRADDHSPEELAARIGEKVAGSKARAVPARDIGVLVRQAHDGQVL